MINIKCPKCEHKNPINLMKTREGSKIICRKCNSIIKLHFEGDTPEDIINKLRKEIRKAFKNTTITVRF